MSPPPTFKFNYMQLKWPVCLLVMNVVSVHGLQIGQRRNVLCVCVCVCVCVLKAWITSKWWIDCTKATVTLNQPTAQTRCTPSCATAGKMTRTRGRLSSTFSRHSTTSQWPWKLDIRIPRFLDDDDDDYDENNMKVEILHHFTSLYPRTL